MLFYSDYTRCIYIWTNNTDYVIKLEEIDFETQDTWYCNADGLITYYTTFEEAGKCTVTFLALSSNIWISISIKIGVF